MKSIVLKPLFALLFLVVFTLPAYACLWDHDTLEAEAKGIPDTIRVITGRFERNPDLYYEMRLARVTKELQSTPEKLELYDDAGVACDRLHRGDEAIAWMHKKNMQMTKLRGIADAGVFREHRYRYRANLGTFVAHRWLRSGADRKKISEMKRARDLIAGAIKLNPNAHFGREKYQLKVIEWIINPPQWNAGVDFPDFLGFSKHLDILHDNENRLQTLKQEDVIEGLDGLITLGDAWQSVDVFYALKLALMLKGDSSAALLAQYRLQELIESGKDSLHPQAPEGEELAMYIAPTSRLRMDMWLKPQRHVMDQLPSLFKSLRSEANNWHMQRTAYMMERLKNGRHPDIDSKFWSEWQEPPMPSLHITSPQEKRARLQLFLNSGFVAIAILFVSLLTLRFRKKRQR